MHIMPIIQFLVNEIKKNKVAVITLVCMGDSINQTLWLPSKDQKYYKY